MNELALFAGAGGGILGGHLLGWRTVAAVEIEDYPRRVLLQRQADGLLPRFPIWDDIRTFDGKPWRGKVDVVSGGFPCQDLSSAGKGAGLDGERSGLWREMARVICEVQPRYAFIENSPMLTIRGLDRVLCDLAQMGFNARWGVVGAADVGAIHQRDRIWIVAELPPPRWPTPTATDWKATGKLETLKRQGNNFEAGGQNRPQYHYSRLMNMKMPVSASEMLMLWPIEWTDLKPLATDKFQQWLQQHGES